MIRGVYKETGPDYRLRGLSSLLIEDPKNSNNYLAQFNPFYYYDTKHREMRRLQEAFSWVSLSKDLFEVLNEERKT